MLITSYISYFAAVLTMLTDILLSVQEWLDRADTEGDTSAVRSRVWSLLLLYTDQQVPPAHLLLYRCLF